MKGCGSGGEGARETRGLLSSSGQSCARGSEWSWREVQGRRGEIMVTPAFRKSRNALPRTSPVVQW